MDNDKDKADLAEVTSKGESDLEATPKNDTTRPGPRPTLLDRAQKCVFGI
jgi:hypothetical protein